MTQHPHPPQDPAHPTFRSPGQGAVIRFTVQGSVLTNTMVAPTVTINGHRVHVPTGGTAPIPAPPGRHHIQVVSQWLRQYGKADLTVDLQPGQQVDVFYAAPLHQFAPRGAIGFTPQKKAGLWMLIGIVVGVVLVIALLFGVLPALLG
ncbi:hypothetical protein [Auraticoccus monumenti]|uniref:PEGA domain-containing protein n=1 Tax=Auraticoccus monumenti TaxID=675864 RepID=A0A1G6W5E3_9ACTN|nr:hypothetical protein [Auraticoccus monumenti]SDD61150.1 hypothetical protein SAMN04489747_1354 [Auraticoccus monumenti]